MGVMPTPDINNSLLLRTRPDLLPTSASQVFGASFSDPISSPAELGLDQIEVMKEQPQIMDPYVSVVGELEADENKIDPKEYMTPKEVKDEFASVGLTIKEPMPRSAVKLLAEQRKEQQIRDDIITRGPYTIAGYSASFFGSTARAFTDPINIASAWFPVVGQARFAGLVAKHGAAKARLLTGLAEGFAGSSVLETGVFGMAKQLKLDYEMTDALMNVALGTVLGGGLHVLGGTTKDRITGRPIAEELATIARLGRIKRIRQLADDAFEAGDDVKGQKLLAELDKLDELGDVESTDTTDEGLRAGQNRSLDGLDDDVKAELAATAVNQVVNNQEVDLDAKILYGKLAQQKRRLKNRIKNLRQHAKGLEKQEKIADANERLIAIEADQQKIVDDLATKKIPRITKSEEAELEEFEARLADSGDGTTGLDAIEKTEADDPIEIPKVVKDEPDPLEGMELEDEDGNLVPARRLLDNANKLVEKADEQEAAIKKAGECLSGVT